MSAKYQRIKKQDLLLPAPLRWLTRAFSSITLAVVLLTLVILFGTVASVPIAFLVKGMLYGLFGGVLPACFIVLAYLIGTGRLTKSDDAKQPKKKPGLLLPIGMVFCGIAIGALAVVMVVQVTAEMEWFRLQQATVIYRMPALEMTELEFYSWWPMKLILGLFVINMVWATIRRIEFKFENIGVLTVHTGIVVLTMGSILYGRYKLEGDTILWREDLGGTAVNSFYDGTTPAVYLAHDTKNVMLALEDLPRYNDYDNDPSTPLPDLSIELHQSDAFKEVFGNKLKATVGGFVAYGELEPAWVDAAKRGDLNTQFPNPAIQLAMGDENKGHAEFGRPLIAFLPSERVVEESAWAIEFLSTPSQTRLQALLESFEGEHGLVVEIPSAKYREVFSIAKGKTIQCGDTGYTLTIEAIGPYGMSFATRGYEKARDTRAMVQINDGEKTYRRLTMHRYPERSQDFVPAPDDPNAGPMGKRTAPNNEIILTYLDTSKPQFHLIAERRNLKEIQLIARLPGRKPIAGTLENAKFPIGTAGGQQIWIHISERMTHAARILEPHITPKAERKPKDEGTYLHALLPIDLETQMPDGSPWKKRIWLGHMRYPIPEYADAFHAPVDVTVPGIGKITVSFSRKRIMLPFSLTLKAFEMQPYPGSDIPADFRSTLFVNDPGGDDLTGDTRLNNPLIYHGFKLSQTGWDPGNPRDPKNEAKDEHGRYINQQRFSILGVGNNAGIRIIFVGSCLIVAGIPWAFYVKPLLVRRKKLAIQQELAGGAKPPKSDDVKDRADEAVPSPVAAGERA